jgi:3-methylcrotonyl-CoA carboxylase alpha subunit
MIKKVLIANRGEIARRIIRTAQKMGTETVAVYSDADKGAIYVREASQAFRLGPPPSQQSYLMADQILEIAKEAGADAIHPGYGFLSENAEFAQKCRDNGIIFVGPSSEAIRAMALKSEAKKRMREALVPVTPGYEDEDQSLETLVLEAKSIGYPVLIKAIAGGGGKGMRLVDCEQSFAENLLSCQREALSSFGDDRILLEKYITKPRHVEVQVFGDQNGSVVHLFERDCSVQRRHQKVLEEAPAPGLSETTRQKLYDAAIKAAKAISYEGAGTIEFLLDMGGDAHEPSVYFMEMNTRLQVEHPVTEEITGIDLVEWQLIIAAGQPLPLSQDEIKRNGHAIEVRLYAEDPENDFLPEIGLISSIGFDSGARVESAIASGDEISPYYDPMIAKIIVHDQDREHAFLKLSRSLIQTHVSGLKTNLGFLRRLSVHEELRSGNLDTGFIARHQESLLLPWADPKPKIVHTQPNAFDILDGFWPHQHPVGPLKRPQRLEQSEAVSGDVMAPMPGKIIDLFVREGDQIKKGDKLLTLSAMKIEHTLKAPKSGTITRITVSKDQQLHNRGLLVVISDEE